MEPPFERRLLTASNRQRRCLRAFRGTTGKELRFHLAPRISLTTFSIFQLSSQSTRHPAVSPGPFVCNLFFPPSNSSFRDPPNSGQAATSSSPSLLRPEMMNNMNSSGPSECCGLFPSDSNRWPSKKVLCRRLCLVLSLSMHTFILLLRTLKGHIPPSVRGPGTKKGYALAVSHQKSCLAKERTVTWFPYTNLSKCTYSPSLSLWLLVTLNCLFTQPLRAVLSSLDAQTDRL